MQFQELVPRMRFALILGFGVALVALLGCQSTEPADVWTVAARQIPTEPAAPFNARQYRDGPNESYRLDTLKEAAAVSWRVDIANDSRPALLALPGHEQSWDVRVPPAQARLRLAMAVEKRAAPTVLKIRYESQSQTIPLARLEVGSGTGFPGGRWHELDIDLSELAGQDIRLCLTTEGNGHEIRGLAFVADPRILTAAPAKRPPNIVLIVVDTLRADRLSLYGHPRQTSPQIDAWARRRGVTFETVVAPSPWTLPSHASLFTGLDAVRHGLNFNDPVPPSLPLLARRLREAGYATRAVTGGAYLSSHYGLDQGFDVFRYFSAKNEDKDEELVQGIDQTLAWLDELPEPFFLFLHTYEVHAPYTARQPYFDQLNSRPDLPPDPVGIDREPPSVDNGFQPQRYLVRRDEQREKLSEDWYARLGDLYDSGIAYADAQLGRLFERLKEDEDRALVALTSDHGEALGEHGQVSHAALYDFNVLVPLVLAFPDGRLSGTSYPEQIRLVDLPPTILETAGLAVPASLDGVSLIPVLAEEATVPREAWSYAALDNVGLALRFDNRFKAVFSNSPWLPGAGQQTLYDLQADPDENVNLATTEQDMNRRFTERLRRHYGETARALRCDIENESTATRRVLLPPELDPLRLKSLELPSTCAAEPCVSWTDAGRIAVDVPARSSLTLYFEDATIDGKGMPTTTPIRCRWQGEIYEGSQASGEVDAELAERLRALGYL